MKKTFFLFIAVFSSFCSFAQNNSSTPKKDYTDLDKKLLDLVTQHSLVLTGNPEDTNALVNRASINYGLKHYEETIADATKLIEINREYLDQAYLLRGMSYLMTKGVVKNTAACADLTKAKELGYKVNGDNWDMLSFVCN